MQLLAERIERLQAADRERILKDFEYAVSRAEIAPRHNCCPTPGPNTLRSESIHPFTGAKK
jgi:hypothetical protein